MTSEPFSPSVAPSNASSPSSAPRRPDPLRDAFTAVMGGSLVGACAGSVCFRKDTLVPGAFGYFPYTDQSPREQRPHDLQARIMFDVFHGTLDEHVAEYRVNLERAARSYLRCGDEFVNPDGTPKDELTATTWLAQERARAELTERLRGPASHAMQWTWARDPRLKDRQARELACYERCGEPYPPGETPTSRALVANILLSLGVHNINLDGLIEMLCTYRNNRSPAPASDAPTAVRGPE